MAGCLVCALYVVGNLKENFKSDKSCDRQYVAADELHNVCTSKREY